MKVVVADSSTGIADEDSRVTIDVPSDPGIVVTADGPQGAAGGSAFAYTHDQLTPSALWTITHNLAGFPNVTVVDSAGTQVEGDVDYTDSNVLTIAFSAAFGGKAYLS